MTNPKVFEFAKEIGMTPLALMDKIKEWQLPIKSHMSEIDPDNLAAIKEKLSQENKTEAAPTKKKAATRKKKTTDGTKAASSKATGAKVVRRKTVTRKASEQKEEELVAEEVTEVQSAPQELVTAPEPPVAETTQKAEATEEKPAETKAAEPKPIEAAKTTEVASSPAPAARKREVSIGHSGVSSSPRRNIVGRMDLSRVSQMAPQRQSREGGSGGFERGGPRGQNQTTGGFASRPKGNIRAGFVAAAPVPEVIEDDFSRKKDDKRRAKPGAYVEGPVAKTPEEEQQQHFDAAEFRKREMVFQPKKKKGMLDRPALQTQITKPKASKRIVKVHQSIKVSDAAIQMGLKAPELIKALMKNGVMATINTDLDFDTIALIVPEFGFEAQNTYKQADEVVLQTAFGDLEAEPVSRPPVITVMGHVDHGKTSLLDAIRNSDVASGEAGGITQHIGAYQVHTEHGHLLTFLDTPGHEAFTAMRARGANVTDIAVIVVAADDGVMPQTAEAISHAKAANVPMIIAVNKIDKQGANPDRIKQQLTEYEVVPEEWGGNTIFVNVSALKKTGINELLEQIYLLAEMAELKSNPKRSGTGIVIEARLDKGRGNVATLLVQDGFVEVGQQIVAGTVTGKVRSLVNDRGEKVDRATPGMPVEILGLSGTPAAGDKFDIVIDERAAEEVAGIRKAEVDAANQPAAKLSLEDIFSKVKQGDVKELAVVLKADVMGSLEALQGMFAKLSTPEVKVKIVHAAAGGITESDVLLATTAKGIVVGFNVRPDGGATAAAKRHGIDIRTYTIVYELIDEMKKAMAGLLTPDVVEKVMGRAEVRNTFNVPKIGTIAGCAVLDGKIQRSNNVRLLRDGVIVYDGKIGSLKRFKDDAKEVAQGYECGIGIENFNDLKVGDVIEAYIKEEVARELSSPVVEA